MRFDPIGVIEACYTDAPDDRSWLHGILDTLRPLNEGRGIYAKTYAPRTGAWSGGDDCIIGGDWRETLVQQGPLPDLRKAAELVLLDAEVFLALHAPSPPVDLLSRRLARLPRAKREALGAAFVANGIRDLLVLYGGDPDRRAVLCSIVLGRRRWPAPKVVHALRHVSAHLNSGRRLRLVANGRRPSPDDALTEAVLDSGGEVHHATGGARSAEARRTLRLATRLVEWARSRGGRSDSEKGVAVWRGLIAGTWSLVDFHDSDGRRFVLARRNSPSQRDPKALSVRERQILAFAAMGHSNKYIGYSLGISAPAVAQHLHSTQHKLGMRSRRELIQFFGPGRWGVNPGRRGTA